MALNSLERPNTDLQWAREEYQLMVSRSELVRELADGPRADGGYDRDVVDSLLADGLAVRRADGLLALPEEIPAP